MGQSDWWYSDSGQQDGRNGGPVTPPQWEQQRFDPYRPPGDRAQQQPAFPSPQPPAPAGQPPKRRENHAVTALLLVLILGAGFGFAWWNHSRLSTLAVAAPLVAASAPECASQVTSWASAGEGARLSGFGTDFGTFDTALQAFNADMQNGGATAGDTDAVRSATAALQADSRALAASPGPSCVPGLPTDTSAAARDYTAGAGYANSAVTALLAGVNTAAVTDLNDGTSAFGKGNAKISAAETAVNMFKAGS